MSQSVWAVVTKYRRLGGLKNKHLLLMVLEAGKFKIKVLADLLTGEGPLPGSQTALMAVSSHDRRGEGALWGLFYKDTNPIYEGSALMT